MLLTNNTARSITLDFPIEYGVDTVHVAPNGGYASVTDDLHTQFKTIIVASGLTISFPLVAPSFIAHSMGPTPLGTTYFDGFYHAATDAAELTQAAPATSHGSTNEASSAHVFIVAGGPGIVDTGIVSLILSGVSISDAGIRAVDTEVLVADITTLSLNQYVQSKKKWLSVTTGTLTPVGASVFSLDINFGLARFEDLGGRDFIVEELNLIGLAAATDDGYDVAILNHSPEGWTFATTGFVPGNGALVSLKSDFAPDNKLVSGEYFSWRRRNIGAFVQGTEGNGIVVIVTTTTNNAVALADLNLGVIFV